MDFCKGSVFYIMRIILLPAILFLLSCKLRSDNVHTSTISAKTIYSEKSTTPVAAPSSSTPVIHVYVALCDNQYQGIVPVPPKIGNGQDPVNNLYWGASLGIKSFLKRQAHWKLVSTENNVGKSHILERCLFKNTVTNAWLVADAYDGRFIQQCTIDFLNACRGSQPDSFKTENKIFYSGGSSSLLAYIGHDGLMDFTLNESFPASDKIKRDAVILACISKKYFAPHLKQTGANPLLWTTGLMCPEAYTLDAAVQSWLKKENQQQVRQKAAEAYHKYQKCGVRAASNLLVSGWD
jgi:hypothetical protein